MTAILVVEDDNVVRDTLCEVLADEGFRVTGRTDGIEALEFLRLNPDTDLVLLDLIMPRMDGYQFRREQLVDDELANIPVIVFTAQEMAREADFECIQVLRKPIEVGPLLQAISDVKRNDVVPRYTEFH